jgi:hypothetical protein
MPAKTPAEGKKIRTAYETGEVLIKDLSAKWDVSTESIRKKLMLRPNQGH